MGGEEHSEAQSVSDQAMFVMLSWQKPLLLPLHPGSPVKLSGEHVPPVTRKPSQAPLHGVLVWSVMPIPKYWSENLR